jgi:glycosyltransferase involved in cell wall biosynthesis
MRKIKIIHVYKSFNVYNGLIEILTILAQSMHQDQFEIGICVYEYEGNDFGRYFEKLGGKIFVLHKRSGLAGKIDEFLGLVTFFRKHQPDIVQTHVLKANLFGIMAAKIARVPVVIGTEMTLKDTAPTRFGRIRDKFIQPLVSFIIRFSDTFMATSEFIRKQWFGEGHKHKISVIYPPFNLMKYQTAIDNSPKIKLNTDAQSSRRLCYVGRLSEEKGVRTLIEAMKIILSKDVKATLFIVGTGPLENELRAKAAEISSSRIVFMGYKANVFEVMRDMDIFILPSRSEGCPIVVLEAMAMGLPVVATSVGGTPELIEDGVTGILVPPSEPETIAHAVTSLINDPQNAMKLGKNGYERAFGKFHPSQFTQNIEHLYLRLLSEKRIFDARSERRDFK